MRSPGEELFAKYLNGRGRSFKYEPVLDGQRPDFRVASEPSDVICEIVDPEPTWPANRVGSGPDPHTEIRAVIGRKKRQGRGAKGRLPYVVVIRPAAGIQPYDPHVVIGAMLGDVAFSVPVQTHRGGRAVPTTLVTTSGGRMQPAQNTRFSAIGVLWKLNPTSAKLDRLIREALRNVKGDLPQFEAIQRVIDRTTAAGTYEPGLEVPRLEVFHNPHAAVPLPLGFFDGPFDLQWADGGDGNVRLVAVGTQSEDLD